MKSLFVTLLILAGAFVAYDYFLAAPWERLVFEKGPRPAVKKGGTATGIPAHEIEDSGPSALVSAGTAMGEAGSGSPGNAATAASELVVKIPALPSREFVPPVVASLEELTNRWLDIPANAFPREVKVRKAVDVKMAVGSARIQPGATAYAKSADKGMLTITPTPTSTALGTVAVADTDLPDQLRQSYEKWKSDRIEKARSAWLGKRTAKPITNVTVNAPLDLMASLDAAGKPVQSNDGSYPLLVASMRAGEVTDITLPRVKRWGRVEPKVVQGQPSWAVEVWYETMVFSGPMVVQVEAVVRDGKVVSWTYPSGEQVP